MFFVPSVVVWFMFNPKHSELILLPMVVSLILIFIGIGIWRLSNLIRVVALFLGVFYFIGLIATAKNMRDHVETCTWLALLGFVIIALNLPSVKRQFKNNKKAQPL